MFNIVISVSLRRFASDLLLFSLFLFQSLSCAGKWATLVIEPLPSLFRSSQCVENVEHRVGQLWNERGTDLSNSIDQGNGRSGTSLNEEIWLLTVPLEMRDASQKNFFHSVNFPGKLLICWNFRFLGFVPMPRTIIISRLSRLVIFSCLSTPP